MSTRGMPLKHLYTFGTQVHAVDSLSGVVVSNYRPRCPGFDSQRWNIFYVVVGLERGPLSLVTKNEELLE
jgi:hypothetical protein